MIVQSDPPSEFSRQAAFEKPAAEALALKDAFEFHLKERVY